MTQFFSFVSRGFMAFIQDFGVLFVIIAAVCFIIKLMRQPIIIGYVLSGLIFSFIIDSNNLTGEQIILLSELGITFLLFLLGLEFDLNNFRYLGKDIILATVSQSIMLLLVIFWIPSLFGFGVKESTYLAILFIFSSTLLVAKWVDDKKETNTLTGKIILGILIMQDLLAIIIMTALNAFQETNPWTMLLVPVKGALLVLVALIFAKYILNHLLKFAIRYAELMFIFSLSVCFFFVELAPKLGYSTAIGAFIGGVTLANTGYKYDIYSRLKPLIIFFNMLFFVGLGFQMTLSNFGANTLALMLLFFLSCFLIKPLVIYVTLRLHRYDLKTSFITGLNLAQFSEFSIIIISSSVLGGILPKEFLTIAIILVVASMLASSYIIKYDKQIFAYLEKYLRGIDRLFPGKSKIAEIEKLSGYQVIFFGFYDLSRELFSKLEQLGKKVVVIEKDPNNIQLLEKEKIPHIFNSVSNPYFFERIPFKEAEIVISSLIDIGENKMIIKQLKNANPKSAVIVTAKSVSNSLELYEAGADYVIYPRYLNEQHVSVLLEDYILDINKILSKKISEIAMLKEKSSKAESLKSRFDINKFLKSLSKKKVKKDN